MKHIVLFSGGANSSYAAWLVAQKYKREDIILLHTPTYSEHPDADRFRKQVSQFLNIPVTVQADGRNIWDLIKDNHCLPSDRIPFCSRILKLEQSEKFYKTLNDDFIVYLGYGIEEWRRVQTNFARLQAKGIKSEYPIKIPDKDIKDIIRNQWKICLPEPYLYLNHNNCIPCFKGGQPHFYQVYKHYPTYFEMAVKMEQLIDATVFPEISLTKLKERWDAQIPMFPDENDMRPCMCAL